MTEKPFKIQAVDYKIDELRPIETSVNQCRSYLIKFIEKYKSIDLLDIETRLLNRCVYKNWNARHAELGIQASRRTVRLLERFLLQRERSLEDILNQFKLNDVQIRLPSRGTLNQLILNLENSFNLLSKIQNLSKTTVNHLKVECVRTNYVNYNILIMSLCSRVYYLLVTLEKHQREFCSNIKQLIKVFKKKAKD